MQDIFSNTGYYSAFPDADRVFSSDKEKAFLIPVGILSKHYFQPALENDILIAIPIEAVEGLIGEDTSAFYSASCRENWLSYSLQGEKWSLDCEAGYFLGHQPGIEWVETFYQQARQSFAEVKTYFEQHQQMVLLSSKDDTPPKQPLITLGGHAFALSNWYSYIEDMPHRIVETKAQLDPDEPVDIYETVVMLNEQNQDYQYLGCVYSYLYIKPQTSWVHLFYDPQNKRVLMTFDYS